MIKQIYFLFKLLEQTKYMIIKRNRFKIGIIGLSNNRNLNTDYTITDPVVAGQKILKTLAKKTRYQVVMFNGTFDQSIQLKKGIAEAKLAGKLLNEMNIKINRTRFGIPE